MGHEETTQTVMEVDTKVKISFGVKRKEEVKLVQTSKEVITVTVDSDEERELEEEERQAKRRKLTHFEDGGAPKDDDEKKKKSDFVIPLVVENDWRVAKLLEIEKEGKLTDTDRAKLAILLGDKPLHPTSEETDSSANAIVVDDSTPNVDADYNEVSIEDFGLAILRGCGWKEGQGIGKDPKVVPLRLPNRRPKGLGLGATPAKPKNGKGGEETEKDDVAKDTLVRINTGRHNGKYAKVESRDDDNNSLYVRLALGGESVKVSLFAIQTVSKKEYDRDSKCINKTDYDREKKRIDRKREKMEGSSRDSKRGREGRGKEDRGRSRRDDDFSSSSSSSRDREDSSELWVRADLVVRFVDEKYKDGRLFNQKMRVVDVASRKDISLEDDRGKVFYGLRQSWMETVIPRDPGERVMVVRGRYAGLAAVMEDKDKRKSRIVARLLKNNKVIDIDFDDVCLFRPKDIDEYED